MDTNPFTNLNTLSSRPKYNLGRFVLMFIGVIVVIVSILSFVTYAFFISAPSRNSNYPASLAITTGDTLNEISLRAEEMNLIRSKTAFQSMMFLLGGDTKIKAGTYVFDHPQTVIDVALKIARGDRDITSLKITIPEGFSNKEIAELFELKLKMFDEKVFLEKTKKMEGYLFPETYFFLEDATTDDVIHALKNQFEKETKNLPLGGKSLEEIVIMASIIEKEALGDDDRKIISGILWKRLSINMALQVDATFKYILGKESSELTLADLKVDSPYNTYTNRGLPPSPICNPGIKSIMAALEPESTSYIYYLHDSTGKAYFASTFEQHKKNKANYLK
jgi:UPF0755 protein